MLDGVSELENHTETIAELLSSPEFAGEFGLKESITGDMNESEVEEELMESIQEIRSEFKSAEGFSDLILSSSELMDSYHDVDVKLTEEQRESPIPDSLIANLGQGRNFLEYISKVSGRDFYEASIEFVQNLERQDMLKEVAVVMTAYFTERIQDSLFYVNTFVTGVGDTIEQLTNISESDDVDISELVDLYRESGTYYEYALPPIVTVVKYLEEGNVEIEETSSKHLANSLSYIRSFELLREFVEPFDTNIRNALSHGGTSGYSLNRVQNSITFRYEVGDSLQTKKMSFKEFKHHTVEASSAAVSMFLLPLFLILMVAYIQIQEKTKEDD